MKRFKKSLVTLLVLVFVLSIMSTGFAAAKFSDVKDEDLSDALARLVALKIIDGYPDGTFKPNNNITRAEFAKVVVTSLGLGNAAQYAQGMTKFKDVTAAHWASGYIKVASDLGVVNGYPDGTFKPENNVTYAEAITMIVRALGYEPKAQALGGYPGGYLAIAAEKGITDKVNVVSTLAATRADVAKMVNNSLDVNLMEQTGFGTNVTFQEVDKTLLTAKLNVKEYKDYRVVATPKVDSKLDKDEIKIKSKDGSISTFKVGDFVKADELLGLKLTAWVKDDKIIFVDYDEAQVVFDMVAENSDGKEISLIKADDTYDFAEDVTVYVDHTKAKAADLKEGQYGRFILEKGEVVFVDVVTPEVGMDGIIVKDVSTKDKTITYIYDSDEESELDLADADAYYIYKDGEEISLDDVKEDDVLYVAKIDDEYYITVVRDKIKGKIEKAKDGSITVNGKTYDKGLVATASQDNDKTVVAYNADAVKDLIGETAVVLLDMNGQVRHVRGDVQETSDKMYGLVIKGQDYYDTIKIFVNGETKTYEVKRGSSDVPNTEKLDNLKGKIVEFTLNKDGKINYLNNVTPTTGYTGYRFDDDYNAILSSSGSVLAYVTSSTQIVRAEAYNSGEFDTDDLDALKWDDIKSKTPDISSSIYVVTNSKREAVFAVIIGDAFAENKAGIVVDKYRTADGWVVKVDVFDAGEKEYVLAGTTGLNANLSKGDVIEFKLNADGKLVTQNLLFDASSTATYSNFASVPVVENVYARDGRYITFENSVGNLSDYRITDKTVVYRVKFKDDGKYDTIEKTSYTKITKGMKAVYVVGDAGTLKVIAYAAASTGSTSSGTQTTLQKINAAANAGEMLTELKALGYAPFDALSEQLKAVVASRVFNARPASGFASMNAVYAQIDTEIAGLNQ
ncbi:S-layer homology domain-containing protein [Caldanaerovirga acetigignens]|uniref:S-layer homology domain-containing protein n=1 Tax=Caldanaerovirga acetigignens TaxID=447595 RepID=A0A1M7GGP5_9FIRM|nr:S-layer homology domain-containing protein [Caldanaerovirga acetigignens]SHM15127.1 S-layer homology domain-containing protein [Caldanaerovirga acetigignens]